VLLGFPIFIAFVVVVGCGTGAMIRGATATATICFLVSHHHHYNFPSLFSCHVCCYVMIDVAVKNRWNDYR
jgi:hypothetical protein